MNFDDATEQEVARFNEILSKHGATSCATCGKPIVLAGCYVSGGSTEAGTGFSCFSIACPDGHEVGAWSSWYPDIETIDEFLEQLDYEWKRS